MLKRITRVGLYFGLYTSGYIASRSNRCYSIFIAALPRGRPNRSSSHKTGRLGDSQLWYRSPILKDIMSHNSSD